MIKQCPGCTLKKDISMFYKNKSKKDGKSSHCKVCHDKFNIDWKKNNPDKYSKYNCSYPRNKVMKYKSRMRSKQYRSNMGYNYICDLIRKGTNLKLEDIFDEMVEIKREQLKIKRILRDGSNML